MDRSSYVPGAGAIAAGCRATLTMHGDPRLDPCQHGINTHPRRVPLLTSH